MQETANAARSVAVPSNENPERFRTDVCLMRIGLLEKPPPVVTLIRNECGGLSSGVRRAGFPRD